MGIVRWVRDGRRSIHKWESDTHYWAKLFNRKAPKNDFARGRAAPHESSKIVLTEVAEFKNPFFRVMTRIFGQTKYMDEHLKDLAKKFGETATVM